ncbi:MAG: AraC family transcriptional regulator [Cytophagales bacterium]|nr:MAG: AraC family transcriptional regulator [Cytophagales bacterium]
MAKIKSGFLGERAIVLPSSVINELKYDTFSKMLYITDIGFYPNATNHFRVRKCTEVIQYILIYCFEGEGWFELDGVKQKVFANQIFILPKGKAHSYGSISKKTWTIYWIHFDGEQANFFADGFSKPMNISQEKDSRIDERLRLFEEIFSTLRNGYSKSNLYYTTTLFFHFFGSIKFLDTFRFATENSIRNTTEVAIQYMRENISKRLSLNDIALFVGLSPSHFTSIFKEKTGYPPLSYLTQLKIQQACHLLDFTNYRVNQISQMLGYEDPLYFSRLFVKIMEVSPRAYRDKKKG